MATDQWWSMVLMVMVLVVVVTRWAVTMVMRVVVVVREFISTYNQLLHTLVR